MFEIHAVASPGTVNEHHLTPDLGTPIWMTSTSRQPEISTWTVAKGSLSDKRSIGVGRNNTPVAADADLETVEQQGLHAEAVCPRQILQNLVMLDHYPTSGRHVLELYVTRTPCNTCTDKILRA